MSVYGLEHLFAPRSIALVGRFGVNPQKEAILLRNVCASDCGDVAAVDLGGGGRPAAFAGPGRWLERPDELGPETDVVIASLPVREVSGLLDGLTGRKVRNMILPRRRMTAEDEHWEEVVRSKARAAGIRLLGLNSFGLIVPGARLNTSFFEVDPAGGRTALISQSGALISSILDRAREQRIGFSHVVSVGSLLDIDFGDVIDFLAWERDVRCLLLYVENLVAVKKFLSACRAAARAKPIVAIKAGRSALGREIIAKHTGRAAGADEVYDTAFRRAGIIRVETIGELLSSGEALSGRALPGGERLGIITNSGGIGALAADRLSLRGIGISRLSPELRARLEQYVAPYSGRLNPICIAADADAERYLEVIRAYVESGEFDTVMVIMVLGGVFSPREIVERASACTAGHHKVDLLYIWLGNRKEHAESARQLVAGGHAIYYSVEEATTAYCYSMQYFDKLSKIVVVPPRFDHSLAYRQAEARELVDAALQRGDLSSPAFDVFGLLRLYGAAVSPGPAAEDRLQLRAGVRTDVEFGPYLFLGVGGPLAKLVPGEAVILPPLNRLLAGRLIEKSGLADRLGFAAADRERLEELLVRLSQLVVDFPQVHELEMDPLELTPEGFVVRGARAVLEDRGVASPDHLATAPYPNQYEWTRTLKGGVAVRVRPIRPEDAPAHHDFILALSRETVYNRFFGFRKGVTDEQLVRFTQIDYDREIALLAQACEDGRPVTVGVNRLSYEPHSGTYEFAVVVADAWQGTGVGSLLMEKLLYIAADRGVKQIYGLVLPANRRMLQLAQKFGFVVSGRDDDAVMIRLDLP